MAIVISLQNNPIIVMGGFHPFRWNFVKNYFFFANAQHRIEWFDSLKIKGRKLKIWA